MEVERSIGVGFIVFGLSVKKGVGHLRSYPFLNFDEDKSDGLMDGHDGMKEN
jgi:hypothetical protein